MTLQCRFNEGKGKRLLAFPQQSFMKCSHLSCKWSEDVDIVCFFFTPYICVGVLLKNRFTYMNITQYLSFFIKKIQCISQRVSKVFHLVLCGLFIAAIFRLKFSVVGHQDLPHLGFSLPSCLYFLSTSLCVGTNKAFCFSAVSPFFLSKLILLNKNRHGASREYWAVKFRWYFFHQPVHYVVLFISFSQSKAQSENIKQDKLVRT